MHGEFEASTSFDHDPLATAEEIQRCGEEVLRWLEAIASSTTPRPIDIFLVREIHRRWFETTFPTDAGVERSTMVLNRKGTAYEVDAILPAVDSACGNWEWRRKHEAPMDEEPLVEFAIAEANALTVRIYDAHPFIDGNTRTTWHLRNYALMMYGLRPLIDLTDQDAYEAAWWSADPGDLDALNRVVQEELARQDRA